MLTAADIKLLLEPIYSRLAEISKDQKELARDVRKLKRDMGLITNYFDREYLDHEKRITQLETN